MKKKAYLILEDGHIFEGENTELPFSLDETVYSKKPIKTIEIISSLDI